MMRREIRNLKSAEKLAEEMFQRKRAKARLSYIYRKIARLENSMERSVLEEYKNEAIELEVIVANKIDPYIVTFVDVDDVTF